MGKKRIRKNSSKTGDAATVVHEAGASHEGDTNIKESVCCLPVDIPCILPHLDPADDPEAERMVCSSDKCVWSSEPGLVHAKCFEKVEEKGVVMLKTVKGRARDWTDKERLKYLWQDRAYDLIFRMFQCPCGQGYLKRFQPVEVSEAAAGGVQPSVEKRKKKELPKLNVAPNQLSQKGVGQYFTDPNCRQKPGLPKKVKRVSESKELLQTKGRNPSHQVQETASQRSHIPGLMLEETKPQKLNIDLEKLSKAEEPTQSNHHKLSQPTQLSHKDVTKSSIDTIITPSLMQSNVADTFEGEIFESDEEDREPDDACRARSPLYSRGDGWSSSRQSLLQSPQHFDPWWSPGESLTPQGQDRWTTLTPKMSPHQSPPQQPGASGYQQSYKHPTLLENVELLQQNISLRQENVSLKQKIVEDRKLFSVSIENYERELSRKSSEVGDLYQLLKEDENIKILLRELILLDTPKPDQVTVVSQTNVVPDKDLVADSSSDSGVSEYETHQELTQKLEDLDSAAKIIATSQSVAEDNINKLDREVKKLRHENVKFRNDINLIRNYFKVFDLF